MCSYPGQRVVQNNSFNPNCNRRGLPAESTWPNVGEPKKLSGKSRFDRLNRLNASRRNSAFSRSLAGINFTIETFQVARPGPSSRLRPAFPKLPKLGRVKAEVSNHPSVDGSPSSTTRLVTAASTPQRSGGGISIPMPKGASFPRRSRTNASLYFGPLWTRANRSSVVIRPICHRRPSPSRRWCRIAKKP